MDLGKPLTASNAALLFEGVKQLVQYHGFMQHDAVLFR